MARTVEEPGGSRHSATKSARAPSVEVKIIDGGARGRDDGVKSRRRASNKGYLGVKFAEYVELLEAIARRERAERDGGELLEYSSILKRVGIDLPQCENAVRLTSRRFSRELSLMANMYEEARRRK